MGLQAIICPVGFTIVVRQVTVWFNTVAGAQGNLIVQDHGTGGTLLHFGATAPPGYSAQFDGHIVIGGGTGGLGFDINVPGPDPWDVSVSGYLLSGTAPLQIVGSPPP